MEKNNNILCVVTFFRHGARNPCLVLDKDLKFIGRNGRMTETGIANTVKKGEAYRLKYQDFLEDPKNITAFCSEVERCQLSLFSRLKGILNEDLEFNRDSDLSELQKHFNSRISSLKVLPIEEDDFFQVLKKQKTRELIKTLKEDGDFKLLSDNLNFYLSENPSLHEAYKKYNSFVELKYVNNPLTSIYVLADYFIHGQTSDEFSQTENFRSNVQNYANVSKFICENEIEFTFLSMPIKKVKGYAKVLYTGFYKKLSQIFKAVIAGETKEKVFLFSGHDNNIISYLFALGRDVKNSDRKFDSELSFELLEKEGKYMINVILNDQNIENCLSKGYDEWKEIEDRLASIVNE